MKNDGIINYEKRLIAFIDLLGFKNAVNKTADGTIEGYSIKNNIDKIMNFNEGVQKINENSANAQIVNAETNERQPLTKTKITFFSDSMIISMPVDDKYYEQFLTKIVMFSTEYAKQGFLVRGGMTFDKLCHTGNICYGPAMNKAYILESTVANYPRIVVDNKAVKELGEIGKKFIVADKMDNMYILDYLYSKKCVHANNKYKKEKQEKELKKILNDLTEIKNNVDKNITKHKDNERILIKYQWYKNYYNDTVKKVEKDFSQPENYLNSYLIK